MRFARGEGAVASGANFRNPFALTGRIKAGNYFSEEVRNVETRSLKVAQLIGEEEVQHRAVFVFFREPSNRFVSNGGARCFGCAPDRLAGRFVFGLLQTLALNVCYRG